MTLETLAKDIAASAEAQPKAMLKEAKAQAKTKVGEAQSKSTSITHDSSKSITHEAQIVSRRVFGASRGIVFCLISGSILGAIGSHFGFKKT